MLAAARASRPFCSIILMGMAFEQVLQTEPVRRQPDLGRTQGNAFPAGATYVLHACIAAVQLTTVMWLMTWLS